ncbi:MAG: 4-hydroxy-3-methylbut-2-enyl diphosphate reductase [Oscillospiraceae bacterium]|nr:4-hydroxy-3-methylbut-2-enyl diphosphate reductase [Oscillospiraceae bacterium]
MNKRSYHVSNKTNERRTTKINLANNAGFCLGIRRAIAIINDLIKAKQKPVMFGPVAHNKILNNKLKLCGVRIAKSLNEIKKDETLVIRAHGVTSKNMEEISKLKINFEDATCPFVKKIHNILKNLNEEIVFIAGNKQHPEIIGLVGNCNRLSYVFKNKLELENILNKNVKLYKKNIILVAQTTFSIDEWKKCVKVLSKRIKNVRVIDTICSTTRERQQEAKKISSISDVAFVVGDAESANTMRLYEISKKHCETYLVKSSREINEKMIKSRKAVGLLSGASTPKYIVDEILNVIKNL